MILITDREPTEAECRANKAEFLVVTEDGQSFSCGYRPYIKAHPEEFGEIRVKDEYDNEIWECNVPVVGWMSIPNFK